MAHEVVRKEELMMYELPFALAGAQREIVLGVASALSLRVTHMTSDRFTVRVRDAMTAFTFGSLVGAVLKIREEAPIDVSHRGG